MRSRILGSYIDVDKAGNLVAVPHAATVRLVVKPKSWVQSLMDWHAAPSPDSQLTLRSTADFWKSIAGALFASFGSNLFWVGAWTFCDQGAAAYASALIPSNMRDTMFVLVGIVTGLLTNRLGLAYYKAPINSLRYESACIGAKLEQEGIAKELAKMHQMRSADERLLSISKLAAQQAEKLAMRAKQSHTCWSATMTLTGDVKDDAEAINRFQVYYHFFISIVGLLGGVFLWVGACNLLSIPLGWLQEQIPADNWWGQVSFDVGIVALSFYLMQASSTLGQRAGAEPVTSGQQEQPKSGSSEVSTHAKFLTLAIVGIDVLGGLLLWVGMCDLLGTQFATSDSDGDADSFGYADDEESMWAQLFYVMVGLLCQISTELISTETADANPEDWHFLPTVFDVASILGGVFLNNGVWTLIDTNLCVSWEYCSFDGSGGGDGWPSCNVRNLSFLFIGLGILYSQRRLLEEAGVESSPVMVLAVVRPRKQARLDMNRRANEQHRAAITIEGSLVLKKAIVDGGPGHTLEDLTTSLAELVAVPEERVLVHCSPEADHPDAVLCLLEILPMRREVASQLSGPLDIPLRRVIMQDQHEVLQKLCKTFPRGAEAVLESCPLRDAFVRSDGDWRFRGSRVGKGLAPRTFSGQIVRKLSDAAGQVVQAVEEGIAARARPKRRNSSPRPKGAAKAKGKAKAAWHAHSAGEPLLGEVQEHLEDVDAAPSSSPAG